MSLLAKVYCTWAILSILLAVTAAGLNAETVTRLLTLAFLGLQIRARATLASCAPFVSPRWRFVIMGTVLAAVVEGFHMISKPVFASVTIGWNTTLAQALKNYAIDLLFTVPAYLVILNVMWHFVNRYTLSTWEYVFLAGLGQTLGDGGIFFFAGAPFMLLFLPYPMTNYHAMNIIPFLAVKNEIEPAGRPFLATVYFVASIIVTYLVCGTLIKLAARPFGLE